MSDLPPRALSIRQPWAWAILRGGKDIENRSWETLLRGPVCIHAAMVMTKAEYEMAAAFIARCGSKAPAFAELQRGGIVGVADITDCTMRHDSPWFQGKFGMVLANARPVEFIPVSGALGFFDWRKRLVLT